MVKQADKWDADNTDQSGDFWETKLCFIQANINYGKTFLHIQQHIHSAYWCQSPQ